MDYAEHLSAHIRLTILRLLAEQQSYFANDAVLTSGVQAMGLPCTREQVRGHIAWLEEQRLVTVTIARGGAGPMTVAALTERGGDVAAGRSVVPGVQRPSPGG